MSLNKGLMRRKEFVWEEEGRAGVIICQGTEGDRRKGLAGGKSWHGKQVEEEEGKKGIGGV